MSDDDKIMVVIIKLNGIRHVMLTAVELIEAVKLLHHIVNADKHNDPHSTEQAITKASQFFDRLKTV